MRAIDKFERYGSHIFNGQDYLKNHILDKFPVVYTEDTNNYKQIWESDQYSNYEYVWLVDSNIKTFDTFPWYFKPKETTEMNIHKFPYVYKNSNKVISVDKVKLIPTQQGKYKDKLHNYICGQYDPYFGKEKFDIFLISDDVDQKQWAIDNIENVQIVDTFYDAQQRSFTDMFWVIWNDTIPRNTFKFSYVPDDWSLDYVHTFGNGDLDQLDGIILCPKNYKITEKELEHRFYANKKEIRIIASDPKPYDVFKINNYDDYLHACKYSHSTMFWGIPDCIDIVNQNIFETYISHHDKSYRNQNHVYKNGTRFDGVVLYSKNSPVSEKEIKYKFIASRIEHDLLVSNPKPFDRFTINSYEDYLNAMKDTSTDMFWSIPDDVSVNEDFAWDKEFNKDEIDRRTNYVFLNGEHRDGVVLFNKFEEVTEKEIENRFYVNKKEVDIVASVPKKYDRFTIDSYEDYTTALYSSKSNMFWGVPSDVNVRDGFEFDLYFAHYNSYDRNINHIFYNDIHRDGVVLFSKKTLATEKEVESRFYVNKKEWDIVASDPKPYPVYKIDNYDDYTKAYKSCDRDLFFIQPSDIIVNDNFDWNFYVNHHNLYERKINHVWKNGIFYDGIALTSKSINLTEREIQYRFYAIKKEHESIASSPKPFDIVFISNGEPNADKNYKKLCDRFPHAKRIDKVKGIHNAHIAAAKLCNTDMFWVVDADAEIIEDFNFDFQISHYDLDGKNTVYVWRSLNPVNGLIYGYGGVKLLPRHLTENVDVNSADMTTSISRNFKAIDEMSNITAFNTDPFNTWKSAFRECVKLSSRAINRQNEKDTKFRLDAWCSRGEDKSFGTFALEGARAGKLYGEKYKNSPEQLSKINDFEYLQDLFKRSYPQV